MRFNSDSAEMVELVLRQMFRRGYRAERQFLRAYYAKGMTQTAIGKCLGISQRSVSVYRRPAAERIVTGKHC